MEIFFYILSNNIIPIFTLIALGFLLNKAFNLDIFTLSKINFYIYVPIFVFVNLLTTEIDFQLMQALIFGIVMLILNMGITSIVARLRGYDLGLKSALKTRSCFITQEILSSVNYFGFSSGILINGETPYLALAVTCQVMILVVQM